MSPFPTLQGHSGGPTLAPRRRSALGRLVSDVEWPGVRIPHSPLILGSTKLQTLAVQYDGQLSSDRSDAAPPPGGGDGDRQQPFR